MADTITLNADNAVLNAKKGEVFTILKRFGKSVLVNANEAHKKKPVFLWWLHEGFEGDRNTPEKKVKTKKSGK